MIFLCPYVNAQQSDSVSFFTPASNYSPKRGRLFVIGVGGAYIASFSSLYSTWYSDYPQSNFHFFNDFNEWNQMDKLGHIGSAYYLSRWSTDIVRWTGTDKRKSAFIGTSIGYLFQLSIEVMDGFSAQWGFSPGDILANTVGSGLFLSQELGWGEQRITFKYSYHESGLAQYRPNTLGGTIPERVFKDYNGQTYWVSTNVYSFLPKESKFPKWLNIAVGYGAEGMLGAKNNDWANDNPGIPKLQRVRQYYLSIDVDLRRIKTKSSALKTLFEVFGFLKIPAPTLEYSSDGKWLAHGFYF